MIVKNIRVRNMVCSSCEGRVERAVLRIAGVHEAKADYSESRVRIAYDEKVCDEREILKALSDAGYEPAGSGGLSQKILGILGLALAVFLLNNLYNTFNIDDALKENVTYFVLFATGLLTSLHCIGMCGGILISQSVRGEEKKRWAAFTPALTYNLGRVVSYTLLGGIVGLIGSVFSLTITLKATLLLLAGVFMVMMGLNTLGWNPFKRFSIVLPWSRYLAGKQGRSSFMVGFFNGLMPCGPLQTMQIYALGTGSPLKGALAMFFFSLGTVPLMLGVGAITGFMKKSFTHKLLRFSGALVIILGLIMTNRGLTLAGVDSPINSVGKAISAARAGGATAAEKATVENGVQVVRISANAQGYVPNQIYVQKGIPVRFIVQGDQLTSCNSTMIIPSLNKEIRLKSGENVVEFTPDSSGEVRFSCWMGMINGAIQVVDNLGSVDVSKAKPIPSSSGGCCGGAPVQNNGGTGGGTSGGSGAGSGQNGSGSVGNDLRSLPTDLIVRKAVKADAGQTVELKGEGYRMAPLYTVVKEGVKTRLILDLQDYSAPGATFQLREGSEDKIIKEFKAGSKGQEMIWTPDKGAQYGLFQDGQLLAIIESVADTNAVDLEALKEQIISAIQ